MAFTLESSFALGPANTGLEADLRAQLRNGSDNTAVGTEISTGFSERGARGTYVWYYAAFPDNFRGYAEIYDDGDPTDILSVIPINPQEAEYLDARVSSISGAAPVGNRDVTIHVRDSVTLNPLSNVPVIIKTALGTLRERKNTDIDGDAEFSMDDGNYRYSVTALYGYQSVPDTAFVVDGDESITVNLIAFPVTPISAPDQVSVDDILIDEEGEPVVGATVKVQTMPLLQEVEDSALQGGTGKTYTANAEGRVSFPLVKGSRYVIKVPLWGVSMQITAPTDVDNTTIRALIPG